MLRMCSIFHRLLTRHARIYTEMITTGAVLHGYRARLLAYDHSEHPVALRTMAILTGKRDYDASRGTVRAWLLTRTRSRALDRRASRVRQARVVEQAAQEPAPEQGDAGAAFDAERVRMELANLPADLVVVLELAYFEGLSSTEIADRLEIPTGTVKSRMARALATLREQLGPATGRAGGAP